MKILFAVLIAATFAGTAGAQGSASTPPSTKDKQDAVRSTTVTGSDRQQGTVQQQEANVKASKATEKMSTDEKNKALKEVNTRMVNPNNSSGVEATAKAQRETTAVSKTQARQRVDLNTPEARKAMEKAATP